MNGPQFYGKRVAAWCAVLVMAMALVAILAGCGQTPEQAPILLPASVTSAPITATEPMANAQPRVMSYAEWRASQAIGIATEDEVRVALIEAGIPHRDAAHLARAVVSCESPTMDRNGQSLGANLAATGDGGVSQGPFQVHVGWNPQYVGTYLFDLSEAAKVAAEIFHQQGRRAWSCLK